MFLVPSVAPHPTSIICTSNKTLNFNIFIFPWHIPQTKWLGTLNNANDFWSYCDSFFLPIATKFGPRSVMNIISWEPKDGMSRNINKIKSTKRRLQSDYYVNPFAQRIFEWKRQAHFHCFEVITSFGIKIVRYSMSLELLAAYNFSLTIHKCFQ